MSEPKEPRFFDHMEGERPHPGHPAIDTLTRTIVTSRDGYEALFAAAGDAKAIGEASPSYLRNPVVPARVRQVLPDVRLVAILRDPVDRAYAAWMGSRRDGLPAARTFEDALREEERGIGAARFQGYVAFGRYAHQLERWDAHFPRERIRVYLTDDLRDDPRSLFGDLFGFLGVDPAFVPDTSERRNESGRVANPVLRAAWERSAAARAFVRPLVPVRLRDRAYDLITRDLVREPMREETRAALRERLRPDVVALQDLLDRDLSHWLE